MPISGKKQIHTLREALAWAHREAKTDRWKRSELSHPLANRFMSLFAADGVCLLETGRGSANYFFMEVEGDIWGVSPFASHEEWWEKPSDGCEGIWIPGKRFDEHVLRGKQKINAPDVHQAIDRVRSAHTTHE